jgi:hypothetical protein
MKKAKFHFDFSDSDLESQEYGRRYPSRSPRGTLYPRNSPTSGGRSVDIIRSRTPATELFPVTMCNCETYTKSDKYFYAHHQPCCLKQLPFPSVCSLLACHCKGCT